MRRCRARTWRQEWTCFPLAFLQSLVPLALGMALPTMGWSLLHQLVIKKMFYMPTGQVEKTMTSYAKVFLILVNGWWLWIQSMYSEAILPGVKVVLVL